MTVLSAQSIWDRCEDSSTVPYPPKFNPMISPFYSMKQIFSGMSYGLSAAGYDVRIAEDLIIPSGGFSLASTIESFCMPQDIVAVVHDKSSWARLGLTVQNTVIEPSWRGFLTLELCNHSENDIEIKAGSPISQILFHKLDEPTIRPYSGKYQDQASGPQGAIHE